MARRTVARALDGNGPQPLYAQVRQLLIDDLRDGDIQPGARLPSERELCERLGVSRVTIRRALSELVAEGVLESSAGRGWFASHGRISEPPNELLSFSNMASVRGVSTRARTLLQTVRPATLDEAEELAIAPGADLFEIERVRLLDEVAVALDRSRVPLALAPALATADLDTGSLFAVLADAGIKPSFAACSVEAIPADERVSELLGLAVGGPVLVVSQRMLDQNDRPVELGRIVYRGDRYRFQATLRATGRSPT
jgi:GntR family transcriptional regulator